jgi:hypothetical protein
MKPGIWDTRIDRGTVWEYTFTWKNSSGVGRDLSGYTAQAVFIPAGGGTAVVVASDAPTNDGEVHVKIEETQTLTDFPFDEGQWRLLLKEPDQDPFILVRGLVSVR